MKSFTNMANETHQVAETLGDRMYLAAQVTNMLGIESLLQSQIASYGGSIDEQTKLTDCANILLSAPIRMRNTVIYKRLASKYLAVS